MRVMIYDATDTRPGIELMDAWRLGAKLYRASRAIDIVFPAKSWAGALMWLRGIGPVDEVQFWGHGAPGAAFIGGERLVVADMQEIHIRRLFWLRTCSSFAGPQGQRFAVKLAGRLGCRVAGHTHIIGPIQSGLHSLYPGAVPTWSTKEGLDDLGRGKQSHPFAPHTISCLHSSVPDRW